MKQFINRVTITGADDSVQPEDLLALSNKYPFAEWGILYSKSSEGSSRFPSYEWQQKLYKLWCDQLGISTGVRLGDKTFNLSCHVCGSWVREICDGRWTILKDRADVFSMFARVQLNFHALVHKLYPDRFIHGFDNNLLYYRQFIFQLDDVNNSILDLAKQSEIDAVGLFDLSGGLGVLPQNWPVAKGYCGYAGGLSPENLTSQLELIEQVALDGPIWIDVETHVRSDNDRQFDLAKVEQFLEIASDWVTNDNCIDSTKEPVNV